MPAALRAHGHLRRSHPGIAAANVLGMYGGALTNVAFFVGWENPTMDAIVTVSFNSGQPQAFTL